uniref:Heat shock 70 kDa protein n=1 Tax=Aegilops tauschii TaxID=37682 RepID=M8CHA5_AEGTA
MADAGLAKGDVDEVVLVGGSTRIPKVQQLLRDYFGGKEPHKGVNPDEAVAYGAAVQGGIVRGDAKEVVVLDVTPLTLGIETAGGVMASVIPRNTPIPTKRAKMFTTYEDRQTTVRPDRDRAGAEGHAADRGDPGGGRERHPARGSGGQGHGPVAARRPDGERDPPEHADPDQEGQDVHHLRGQADDGDHHGVRGRAELTKDNRLLGRFDLTGIAPAPRGTPQIEVTLEVDVNGILHVGAADKGTGRSEKIEISSAGRSISQEEIERMVQEAEEFAEEDRKVRDRVDARNKLEAYVYSARTTADGELGDKMDGGDRERVREAAREAGEWLEANPDADKDDYTEKLKELEDVCSPAFAAAYGNTGGGHDDTTEDHDHDEL